MADRPIIFSAPMVRALLDGRKTQTRRLIKPQPGVMDRPFQMDDGSWHITDSRGGNMSPLRIPYAPGDRLYVREAMHWTDNLRFVADDAVVDFDRMPEDFTAGRPHVSGMFMPRWASRITLTVTDVRVQRLQEISEADAVADGVTRCAWAEAMADDGRTEWHVPEHTPGEYPGLTNAHPSPVGAFWELWNALHGPEAWDANPWVVALTFTV
jgi:hypothetical protein